MPMTIFLDVDMIVNIKAHLPPVDAMPMGQSMSTLGVPQARVDCTCQG